jgi:ATP-dependent RNA helicase DeaD
MGFDAPMPVQEEVIPLLLHDRGDVIALAQTGTGKTAAYGLPALQKTDVGRREPQTLILCPTRELCLQIASDLSDYSAYIDNLSILPVYGGSSIESQIKALRKGVHIIVATPGRLQDLMNRRVANLATVRNVILDEADEMLSMGFSEDLENILKEVPAERNMLLFSATMPPEIERIAGKYMHEPQKVTIGRRNQGNENIRHIYYMVHAKDKYAALKRLADYYPDIYGIIFCRTRRETQEIADALIRDGYNADALHGELTQQARDFVMQKFRNRNLQLLVATDVAARGLDVDNLTHIIHYGLPDETELYTHRSGRTARAGKTGISIAICHTREKGKLRKITETLKCKFEKGVIPDNKTICEKQLFNFADKIERVEVNEDDVARLVPSLFRKLEWLEKEDLLKRVISLEFNRLLEYYHDAKKIENVEDAPPEGKAGRRQRQRSGLTASLGEKPSVSQGRGVKPSVSQGREAKPSEKTRRLIDDHAEPGMKILRLNFGRRDALVPAQLIEMLNHCVKGRRIEVGRIELHDDFTLFEVSKGEAGKVMDAMNRFEADGRNISVRYSEKRSKKREIDQFGQNKKQHGKKNYRKK